MSSSSCKLDRLQATFDHGGIVANAGLIVPATLMARLGLEALIDAWVKTGSSRPGRKVLTLVAAMLAGATHIDHVDMLRAGATQRVLPFKVMAPSTVGSFLRSFTFGHVRQLDAVLSRTVARAWAARAGPGDGPLVVDLDSTICEVHGKQKQAASMSEWCPLSSSTVCWSRLRSKTSSVPGRNSPWLESNSSANWCGRTTSRAIRLTKAGGGASFEHQTATSTYSSKTVSAATTDPRQREYRALQWGVRSVAPSLAPPWLDRGYEPTDSVRTCHLTLQRCSDVSRHLVR